jgi:hypothetical protein
MLCIRGNGYDTVGKAVSLQSQNISDLIIAITEAAENLQEVLHEIKTKPWSILYKEGRTEYE